VLAAIDDQGAADGLAALRRAAAARSDFAPRIAGDATEHEQVGLLVWSPDTDKGGALNDVTLEKNSVSTVGGFGIKVHSGHGIHLIGNAIRRSTQSNITVTQKATGVTQQDNTIE